MLGKATRGVMEFKLSQHWQIAVPRLRFFLLVVLIVGIVLRFVNLDQKVVWGDETLSSFRIAGYSEQEVIQNLYTGREISVADLQKYQRAGSQRNPLDTLETLAAEAANHPPLYYVPARIWEDWFGSSVAVKRTFPALISLLVFPCLYWLCLELLGSPLTGWLAIALVAVSPIHFLYAQEVRQYSLWTVTALLSSASLLYAIRVKTKWSWRIYGLTLAIGFYSHLFSAFVAIGQGIYVLAIERLRWSKTLKAYLFSAIAGLALFLPWLVVFLYNESHVSKRWGWVVQELPPLKFYQYWLTNFVRGFLDVPLRESEPFILPFNYTHPITYISFLLVVLVAYAFYVLVRKTPKQVWLFVLILTLSTTLPMVLPDLISGGKRSTLARYQLPSYLGMQIAVAYLLSTKLGAFSASIWRQQLWRLITVVLLSCGVISCGLIAQAPTWWTKYSDYDNAQIAQIINQSNSPLVLSDTIYNRTVSFSYLLEPNVRLQLVNSPRKALEIPATLLPNVAHNSRDVFFLEIVPPPSLLRTGLEKYKNYQFELVYEQMISFNERKTLLWKLVQPE